MVDIEKLKPIIIEKLKPLNPDKIILFGSYAYGTPNEDSDIDLFLLKDDLTNIRKYELEAMNRLISVQLDYNTNGIDILSAPTKYIKQREDYFYKVDILQNGKVWYERTSS